MVLTVLSVLIRQSPLMRPKRCNHQPANHFRKTTLHLSAKPKPGSNRSKPPAPLSRPRARCKHRGEMLSGVPCPLTPDS
jgi:hypothetical protein